MGARPSSVATSGLTPAAHPAATSAFRDAVQPTTASGTADAGSFSAAARQLNLTPAAVGKSVAALEAHLDVRLFNRTTRQLSLTEEGERVAGHGRAALLELAQADQVAQRDGELRGRVHGLVHRLVRGLARGLVRISSAVGFGRRFVLPAVEVAVFYPHRSGLASRVRTVLDLLIAQLRVDVTLSAMNKLV